MKLSAHMPDGSWRELRIAIGEARQVGEQAWACRIAIHGAHGDLGDVLAAGEAEVRRAAAQMLRMLLSKMQRAGHAFYIEERQIEVSRLQL